jgi:hypothetical protein
MQKPFRNTGKLFSFMIAPPAASESWQQLNGNEQRFSQPPPRRDILRQVCLAVIDRSDDKPPSSPKRWRVCPNRQELARDRVHPIRFCILAYFDEYTWPGLAKMASVFWYRYKD